MRYPSMTHHTDMSHICMRYWFMTHHTDMSHTYECFTHLCLITQIRHTYECYSFFLSFFFYSSMTHHTDMSPMSHIWMCYWFITLHTDTSHIWMRHSFVTHHTDMSHIWMRYWFMTHHTDTIGVSDGMGWLRSVASLQLQVSFAEYRLFDRTLLQKRPISLSILLTEATPDGVAKMSRLLKIIGLFCKRAL